MLPADLRIVAFALAAILVAKRKLSAPFEWLIFVPLLALPAWGALQLVPLPMGVLQILSPERAALLRELMAFDPSVHASALSFKPSATATYVLRLLCCVGMFVLARDVAWRNPRKLWMLTAPPLIVAAMQSAIGLAQYSAHVPNTFPSGTFVNRDHYSALLEMCFALALTGVFEFWTSPRRNALLACVFAISAALSFAAIAVTLSRGGFAIAILTAAAIAIAFTISRTRGGTRIAIFGAIATAVSVGAVVLASDGLIDRVSSESAPLENRVLFWREALQVVANNPFFGCGYGAFVSGVYRFRTAVPTRTLDHAHNDFLELLAEGGVVALGLVLFLGFVLLRRIATTLRNPADSRERSFALACGVSLVAVTFHATFDFPLNIPAIVLLFSWIAGASSLRASWSIRHPHRSKIRADSGRALTE